MPCITIGAPEIASTATGTTVSASITRPGVEPIRIWFDLPIDTVSPEQASDAFFVIGHRIALAHGASLAMTSPVSQRLVVGAGSLADIFTLWWPDRDIAGSQLQVTVRQDDPALPPARGLATCFSGGVDSMYSLLNPPRELTHAVFVHGFDISLTRDTFHSKVSARLNQLADETGVIMLQPTSNVRDLVDDHTTWGYHLHGAAIAGVGILLAGVVDELLLPSSGSSLHIGTRNGSHHATDRLLSTDYLTVTHHGTGVSRIDKTALIAQNPSALRTTRPCYRSYSAYNCGECMKCIRTSLDMEVIGCRKLVKRNFKVWHTRKELLAGLHVDNHVQLRSARGAIAYIDEHGGNAAFRAAFRAAAADFEMRQAQATLLSTLGDLTPERTDREALAALQAGLDEVRARWRRQARRKAVRRVRNRIRSLVTRRAA